MGPKSKTKIKYYVVKRGHKPGIYMDWQEAVLQIKGFSGATFCSFSNKKEAEKYMHKVDEHDTSSTNEMQSMFGKENGAKAKVSTGELNNPTVLEVKDTLEEYITIDEVSTFDELEKTVKITRHNLRICGNISTSLWTCFLTMVLKSKGSRTD